MRTTNANGVPSLQRAVFQLALRADGCTASHSPGEASVHTLVSQARQSERQPALPPVQVAPRSLQVSVLPSQTSPGSTTPLPHGVCVASGPAASAVAASAPPPPPSVPSDPPPHAASGRQASPRQAN